MGWHYILRFKCKLHPEYIKFIENEYMRNHNPMEDNCIFGYDNDRYIHSQLYDDYINGVDDIMSYYNENELSDYEKEIIDARKEGIRQRREEIEEELRQVREKRDGEYNEMSSDYKQLMDIWKSLPIGPRFYQYDLSGNVFSCEISKKVNTHNGDLRETYEEFLHSIIVPISREINECSIESDDFGDAIWYYSDSQLRSVPFNLREKIAEIDHTYNDDNTAIIETTIKYKHPINVLHTIDINRYYARQMF